MRRVAPLALLLLAACAGCSLRSASPPPSPFCRSGDPLAGVYHPSRLEVRSRCRVASGRVERVKFEDFDGDVHVALRLDPSDRELLSAGNAKVDGTLVVEIVPQDRSRVLVPEVGSHVTVVGPWVEDTTHDWMEIHPAWSVSEGTIRPASPSELRRVRLLLAGVEVAGEEDDG